MPSYRNEDEAEADRARNEEFVPERIHLCTLFEAAEVPGGIDCDTCLRWVYYGHACVKCGGGRCDICQAQVVAKRVAAAVERFGLEVKRISYGK